MPRAPMPRPTAWPRAALAALFMAFALTAIAPDNAAAQATSLDLGTVTVDVNGTDTNLDLILIRPITTTATAGGKLYYYLDPDNSNAPNGADSRTHDVLNALLNDGDDTIDTQTTGTGHDGSDDERSVIVGPYALILPTLAEWTTLHSDRNPISLSPRWPGTDFHTATLASPASHNFFRLDNGGSSTGSRGSLYRVAFQVITLPPAAPTGVTLTPGHEQITVMWTAVSDTSTPTLTYTNTATATDTTDASNTFTCNANSRTETECTIASLANGTTYSVAVVATNNHGTSTPSAALMSAPVATAQPTHLTLSLGTHEDINLNLIFPVILNDDTPETTDDKLYYYVDRNGNGTTSETVDSHIRDGDAVNFDMLDNLFNGGANVIVTQEPDAPFVFGVPGTAGDHDGTEDERSVIIGNYAVVLPTFNELHALYLDQGDMPPADWAGRNSYRTATPQGNARHYAYHFSGPNQASAIDDGDTSGRVAVQVITLDVTAPTAAPTAVTATPTIDNTVRIEWTALLDADNGGAAITTYTATATPAGTFTGDDGTCTDDGTTITTDGNITCTITGLMHDITYDVTVTATNSVGTGDPSTAARVIPGRPAVPQDVTLDPGNGQIIVRWTLVPSGDTGGADVTGYRTRLFNSPAGGPDRLDTDDACTADATTNTCTITGLTSGNRYRVVVHATNIRGDSIASDSDFAILSGLSFTPARIADQTLSVDQPDVAIVLPAAGAGNPPYTYTLARSDDSTPLLPSGLVFNPANRTISGTPTEAFGTNGGVELVYTATDSDTPTPDIGTLTFRLTVNDDAILIGSFRGINLNLRYPVTVGGKNYYYNDANNNGTAERTVIRAVPGDDVSIGQLRSLLNDGNPIPETPDAQRSVVVGAYTLMLPTIAEMVALRDHPPAGSSPANWNNDIYHTATDSMNNRVFSLFDGRRYESSPTVAWPVAFQVIIAATAPTAAPTGVTARPTTDATTLRIDWTPVRIRDNGGASITTYTATATPTGTFTGTGDAATCTADGPTATNCDISGLTNGTEYSVDVIATNSAGNSPKSDTVTVIPGRPAAPTDVTLMPGDMQIMVTWTAVPDENNGGNAVNSYKVAADVSNADALTHGVDGGVRGRCTATATACTITGLVNGVPHRVIVRATNGRGDSIASSGVSATPVGEVGLTLTPGALTMDEGGTATYTAVLGTQPSDTVTVTISSNNTYVAAPTPLTFATTDWNRAQTVTITAAEDADADNDSVTLTHTAAGGDYAGQTGTVMVTVTDNDLVFNPNTIEDQRHNINEALTLLLPEATGGVGVVTGTVTYTLTRHPATSTPTLPAGLSFDPVARTISGTPTEAFGIQTAAQLVYTAADTAKTGVLTFSFRVTPVPALTLTPAALTFAEGSTTTYTAALTSQPTADVTVAIAGHTGTDLTVMTPSAGMLTFTMTNWDAAQTVTLTAAEDADAVDETPVTLGHTVTSTDTDYDSLTRQDLSVTITDDDTAALTLTPGALTFDEGGTANYTVVLDTEPTVPVTVTITGHATTDLTVMTPDSSMLMFDETNWETPQTVTLTAGEDTDTPEENDTVTLTHTAAGGEYDNVTGDATVTIMDNDVPGLLLSQYALTLDEGTTATYTVRLTIAPDADVTVTITVPVGGAGLRGVTSNTLMFTTANWNEEQNFTIAAPENNIDAADGGAILAHTATSNSGNYSSDVAVRNLVVTIADNDTRGLTLTPGALTFDEGGTATYTAVLDSEPTANVTVTVAIDNTDVTTIPAGDGFVFEPGNWDTPQTLTFTAAEDDDLMDDSATLTHTIRGGDYTGLDAVVLDVTVTDNDIDFNPDTIGPQTHNIHQPLTLPLPEATNGVGIVTYTLTRPNSTPVLVGDLTFNNLTHTITGVPTAGFGVQTAAQLEYTAADSASAKTGTLTFSFQVLDLRGITLNPTAVTMDEGGTATYTVRLDSEPTETVEVTISGHDADGSDSANDLAIMSPASGTLIFDQMNWNIEQTVTLTADRDMEAMGTDEMNDTVTLTHTASGGDYTGLPAVTADLVVNITDTGAPNLLLLPTSLMLTEGGTGTYTVGLTTSPDAAVTVTVGGFTSTDDVTPTPTVLTFTTGNWNTPQTVIIDVAEDDDAVVDATVTLTHTVASSGNYMTGVAVRNLSVTIDENDTVGLNLMPTSLTLAEGNTATYTAVLATAPTADVTVMVDGFIGTDVTPTPTVLTFATGNWSTAQTFTITAAEDGNTVDEAPVTLMHTAEGGDYTGLDAVDLDVTIIDNDDTSRGPLVLSPDPVADRIYPLSGIVRIPPLTLPEASGGQPPYIYTLTRGGNAVLGPNGFNFAAPPSIPTIVENSNPEPNATNVTATAPIIISGLPNESFGGAGGAQLVYTVTDSNNPVTTSISLTFNVRVVPVTLTNSGGAEPVTDEDGTALAINNVGMDNGDMNHNLRLFLPDGHGVTTVTVNTYTPTAGTEPTDYTFSGVAMDIDLTPASKQSITTGEATVCLSITGVNGNTPALFLGGEGTNGTGWTNIGSDTTTRDGFVCGKTSNFAPYFAVASMPNAEAPEVQTLSFASTVANRIYLAGIDIPPLTLPEADGGTSPLGYTLTPQNSIPAGLSFDTDDRTLTGTPTKPVAIDSPTLTYTVTDSATPSPQTASLTFSVSVRTHEVSVPDSAMVEVKVEENVEVLAIDNVGGDNNNNNVRLPLTGGLTLDTALTVTTYTPPADTVPAANYAFSGVAVDINIDLPPNTEATVCLSTVGVPDGHNPALFHYDTPSGGTAMWNNIGTDITTRPGFVCGTTDTFSPVAVGSEAATSRLTTISEIILPEVARAMTDNTVRAITQRFDQARTARQTDTAASAFTLGGQSTLADVLRTGGQALADGTLNMNNILGNSAFVLPLSSGGGVADTLTLWGSGGYSGLGGGGGGAMDWDGNLVSAHLGADAQVGDTLLAGAAVSWNQGDFDYGALTESPEQGGGNYAIEMTSITPYAEWAALPDDRLNIWGTAGYGEGEVTIIDSMVAAQTNDTSMVLWGGGASGRILKNDAGELRLKSELMQTQLSVAGGGALDDLTVEARRMRVSLAGTTTHTLADGAHLTPTVEVGMRSDSGNGRTGTGAEVGGGVRYTAPVQGITFESRSRVLLGHTGDYDDWGIGGVLAWNTGQGGQGLALRLAPTYGQTAGQAARLWDQGAMDLTGTDAAALGQRMDAEVGYGLTALDGQGLLTPYSKMTWGQGARAYRLGSRMTLASGLTMSFEGVRGETLGSAAATHQLQWQTGWRWLTASMQASGVERRMQLQAEWQW